MARNSTDIGVLTVLAQRMAEQRLPRALAMKDRVDRGERLSEHDLAFLQEVTEDAKKIAPLLDRNPEYQGAAREMSRLYQEIMAKAQENEKSKNS